MSWNYRIIEHTTQIKGTNLIEVCLCIHEVYYDEEMNIDSWTENGTSLVGNDIEDLKSSYELMKDAFGKPILIERDGKLIVKGNGR